MSTLPLTSQPRRTQAQITEVMRAVPRKSTEPERLFRKALRKAGIRGFKICQENLPGKPDIVIPGRRLAIFIDGDFWHGNQYRTRGHATLEDQLNGIHNAEYWQLKIQSNIERDLRYTSELLNAGWRVARFWESEIRSDIDTCVEIITRERTRSRAAAFWELPQKTVAEFFAGIGLVRLAFDLAGWKTIFANDNDPQKIEMYKTNFGNEGLDSRNIHDLKIVDIPTCALATASFPCNDLSLAGSREGLNGTHSSTFWGFIRLLRELGDRRPPIVLLENVPGFLTSHQGKDFTAAIAGLNNLGYACDPLVIDASDFVPQSRARLFVVGKQGLISTSGDAAVTKMRPRALVDFIKSHPELLWDIRTLPEIQTRRMALENVLEELPENDERWWSSERAEYFLNQLSQRHLKAAKLLISQNHFSYGTAFRRIRNGRSMAELRFDGMAGCLRTPRGGSGRQILFKGGKGKYAVRLLTPRECARLQGAPDESYKIEAKDNQALFGFGDAVCVPVVRWIAENYLTPLISELLRGRILFHG
jgi:DNA (cytosine-5)-methyltransferase 1